MRKATRYAQSGLTLVELMVAMTLGLLLMLGVTNIFVSNRQAFRTSENLAGMQENGRIAFEMLSREIREAGTNPCGSLAVANVLTPSASSNIGEWWTTPIRGFDNSATGDAAAAIVAVGTGAGSRVAGTDALLIMRGTTSDDVVVNKHVPPSAVLELSTATHGLKDGDIVMVCDQESAAVFQISNVTGGNIVHNTGTGSPGNCTKGLGYPALCGHPLGNLKDFSSGTLVSSQGAFWYIGNNGRGGRSLYRRSLTGTVANEEIVENVTDLQMEYLLRDSVTTQLDANYVAAGTITDWSGSASKQVVAVRLNLNLTSREAVDTSQSPAANLQRRIFNVVQLRARETL